MIVVVSVDMEGASQLRSVREIFGCFPEYWATGRPRLEADVAAACEGLLAGGADELVVLDNHGGNRINVRAESLPAGARLETWNAFDLRSHGVDAMFQVGYHARGGVDGFLSHTYVPGLRLRLDDELISESHWRAWTVGAPLLGIVGNDLHLETLGSLAATPYLVVQHSHGRGEMTPVYDDPSEGLAAIRGFAERCARNAGSAPTFEIREGATFAASLPNGDAVGEAMAGGGWARVGDVEYAVELESWESARAPLDAAMGAGLAPYGPYWLGSFDTAEDAAAADQERVAVAAEVFDAWGAESQPQWYSEAADPLPRGFSRH